MIQKNVSALNKERYHQVIENIDNLPSLPAIVSRLIKVVNSPDSSADDAAKLIEQDPALTSKMIRLANSAFYGIPRSISSVASAVVILGFNTIRSLALSASVMKMFSSVQSTVISKDRFWKHSIISAIAAKLIVRHFMNIRMMDPESAFCAGILHDIGKLIFNEFANEGFQEAFQYASKNKVSLLDAEKLILGINHAEIGRIIADKWALPLDLEYSLVYHHKPAEADKLKDLVATVHIADIMAHRMGAGLWEDETYNEECANSRSILQLQDDDYKKISESLAETAEKSIEFFNIIN